MKEKKIACAVIVEDEGGGLDAIQFLLSSDHGHHVRVEGVARTAEEGVRVIRALSPDLIFLDINLGTKDAFHMLKKLMGKINFKIIFTSGYKRADEAINQEEIRNATVSYLYKPIDPDELAAAIANYWRIIAEEEQLRLKIALLESQLEVVSVRLHRHFDAGTLNALQYLILNDENEKALDCFEVYAKLSGQILERSNQPFWELGDELEFIRDILKILKLRFGDRLEIGNEIDRGNIHGGLLVPTFTLFPFIEMVILRGIKGASGKSRLSLFLRQEKDSWFFRIQTPYPETIIDLDGEDEIQMVLDRMELLHQRFGYEMKYEINEQQESEGQRLDLVFPKRFQI